MDEILLCRPFLRKTGFDLKSHLREVASQLHENHYGDLNPDETKVSSATNQGLRYDVADDPISLPDSAGASIDVDSRE